MSQPSPDAPSPDADPGFVRVREYLLFSLSLPERTLRSATGIVGGALRESASLLVPQSFRSSKTYTVMVQQMLDFMAEDVGGVCRQSDTSGAPPIENFVARKAVGNFIDLAGIATLHLSPLLVLAVMSDVAHGSRAYLQELAGELKQQGVIDQASTIDHVDDLLSAVAETASTASTAFNTPPISLEGLKQTIDDTRAAVAHLDPTAVLPQAEVRRLWEEIHQVATSQGVNPLAVSSVMTLYSLDKIGNLGTGALSGARAVGALVDRHVLEHYRAALTEIATQGLYATLAKSSKPYIEAVWLNFSTKKSTVTEELLSGRMAGRAFSAVRRWLGGA